ncbi:SlyX family protein [Primorskyibacter aestuariivivens]|uniref:SlyX family protein n=1 Tax=Primorskyibacter aestuariivivens TaxID=1888912 RepID=UPI002301D479|nr:SlyX family protein [Primorskyibacter aestuariivivens]MDA7428572.1 SlyX family protein [Primorskyibacter aestuariivivens]
MTKQVETLEEQLAHLQRAMEEMSDVIARQDSEIALLTRRVQMLMEREAERQADQSGGVVLGDERPPHY